MASVCESFCTKSDNFPRGSFDIHVITLCKRQERCRTAGTENIFHDRTFADVGVGVASAFKENSHQKISVATAIEPLLKSFGL